MKTWKFDPINYTIRNIQHGTWEIDLTKVKSKDDLLYWILQAARHQFDIKELFEEFLNAAEWSFGSKEINGAVALSDIFHVSPEGIGPVDWVKGKTANPKIEEARKKLFQSTI